MALYDEDYYAWTQGQAAALRQLADARANLPLDLANLAEEVEDLGNSAYAACASFIVLLVRHLLKLEHSPAERPREGWMSTVLNARLELDRRLTSTLRRKASEDLAKLYADGRRLAAFDLKRYREAADLPSDCPYGMAMLLDSDWYPENRHGLRDED